ncbi:MAG: hypothetical protein KGL35_32820 [Bradyrhizobium sp.]|nr:hypothetical protein [Bradyrhizobium sp.]
MGETTSLTVVQNMNAALVFVPGGAEPLLARLEREAREQAAKLDIATPAGRSAIASLAFKIARSKTALDKAGKDLKAEWKAKSDAVDAERRIIWDRVEALQTEIRAPLTAYEDAEKAAIVAHEAALAEIVAPSEYGHTETAAEIGERIVRIRAGSNRDWGLFAARAQATTAAEIVRMEALQAAAAKREADAADLARLRAEAVERERQAAIEAQREREKAIARRAEEEATRRAREEADRQAREAAAAAEAALQAAREEAARKEREAAEAIEAERRRADREHMEAQAAAERAEAARQRDEAALKMAEARAEQIERDRLAAIARAEKDAAELAAKVEAQRQEALRQAEQRRLDAVAAERRKIEQKKAEEECKAAARAANIEHKRQINLAAQTALGRVLVAEGVEHDVATSLGRAIVIALASGKIPSAKIEY